MAFDFGAFYRDFILNKIVTALIIFFIGFILAKIASNLTKNFLEEFDINKKTLNTFLGRINLETMLSTLIAYIIYITTIIMALNTIGITRFVFISLLILFGILLISTLVLDIRDLIPNLLAFIKIKNKKYFVIGDRIKTNLAEGVVKNITPLTTRIFTKRGDELYIQNYAVLENLIVEKHKNNS